MDRIVLVMSMFVVMPAGVFTTVIVIGVAGLAWNVKPVGSVKWMLPIVAPVSSSPVSVTGGTVNEFSPISMLESLISTSAWTPV